jgi:uncharacterized membrane protein
MRLCNPTVPLYTKLNLHMEYKWDEPPFFVLELESHS